jgi:hypothetical protein
LGTEETVRERRKVPAGSRTRLVASTIKESTTCGIQTVAQEIAS